MEKNGASVDNSIYNQYGDRWYTAQDDPVALLRAESKVKKPWIEKKILQFFPNMPKADIHILDIGCGGGFLSNALAMDGFSVTGLDISEQSLEVARRHDGSNSVAYLAADANALPFPDGKFSAVTAMDFLEHVENPGDILKEVSRVLKPGGLFFFHTFNRNILAYFVVIKLVEWLVKNTPKNMHVLRLFIKPKEMRAFCANANMEVREITGIKPVFGSIPLRNILSGIVPESLRFETTSSLVLSYLGFAIRK